MARYLCIWPEAFLPGLETVAESQIDRPALIALANSLRRFSPHVGLVESRAIVLDLRSADSDRRSFDDWKRSEVFSRLTAGARIAVADTIGAAWGLAGWGAKALAAGVEARPETQPTSQSVRSLPVAALRLGSASAARLRSVGLRTVEDLIGRTTSDLRELLQSSGLAERVRRRIDQVLGLRAETFHAVEPAPRALERVNLGARGFGGSQLRSGLQAGLTRLETRLERDGWGARRLVVRLFDRDGVATSAPTTVRAPLADAETWLRLIETNILRASIEGELECLLIEAHRCGPIEESEPDEDAEILSGPSDFTTLGTLVWRVVADVAGDAPCARAS
ncbi:hypothetical protein GC169_12690 [bacterium]|nr:hypothetical protein [bacterium]